MKQTVYFIPHPSSLIPPGGTPRKDRRLMRWPRALLIGTALLALSGCHSCSPVERELRATEIRLRETNEELQRQQAINRGMQCELETLHGGPGIPGIPGVVSDKPLPVYPVRSLTLGRQTGGVEGGSGCGDQALQVIVEPRDADNQSIKVPGSLIVQVLEVSPEGTKRPLSTWEVGPDALSRTWRSGLLTTGYALTFPWKMWPSTEKLRVVVQMRLNDGRVFEADRDVTVRLPPPGQRRMIPPPPEMTPAPEETLPQPRPAETIPQPADGPKLEISSKPMFNQVRRDPVAIPTWNDAGHSSAVQMQRPMASDN
jgi:hypothetical protein